MKPTPGPADAARSLMDLRDAQEIRPDALARHCVGLDPAAGAAGWDHACSHTLGEQAERGALVVGRGPGAAAGAAGVVTLHLRAAEGPEASRALLSASVLKLRRRGRGVVRLRPGDAAGLAPGWDGAGWLGSLGPTPR